MTAPQTPRGAGGLDASEFERRLFPWIDGELPPAEAAEMEAYCAAHPDARARADAERAFEARVRSALVADAAGGPLVAGALRAARGGGDALRGRIVPFPRWAAGLAASVVAAVGGMWWLCIPPFECAFVQAAEVAAGQPSLGEAMVEGLVRERVALVCDENGCAWRTVVDVAGAPAVVLLAEGGHEPSVRRRRTIDGRVWWIGEEHDRRVVAFPDPAGCGTWCFVGGQDEATLLGAASRFREERAGGAR